MFYLDLCLHSYMSAYSLIYFGHLCPLPPLSCMTLYLFHKSSLHICWLLVRHFFEPPKLNLNQPQVKLSPVILNSLLEKNIQPQINFFFHHIFVTFTPLFNSYDLKSTLTIGFSFQTEWVSLSV